MSKSSWRCVTRQWSVANRSYKNLEERTLPNPRVICLGLKVQQFSFNGHHRDSLLFSLRILISFGSEGRTQVISSSQRSSGTRNAIVPKDWWRTSGYRQICGALGARDQHHLDSAMVIALHGSSVCQPVPSVTTQLDALPYHFTQLLCTQRWRYNMPNQVPNQLPNQWLPHMTTGPRRH